VARGFALALAEALVVGKLHRLLERGVIVAGVVGHDHRRLMREVLDEVALAQFRGVDAHFTGAHLGQALDHEGRLRPPGAAIGVDRHGVGVDRVDLAIDLRDRVLTRKQGRVEIGRDRRREGRHVGAEVGDRLSAQAEDFAVAVERHFRMGDVIAAVRVGEKRLAAFGDPLHRTANATRRP
jgi:hypothetical protein